MSDLKSNNPELWLKRIRNLAGFLGMVLPWISLLGAYLFNLRTVSLPDRFWSNLSISATYYITPALVGILTAASVVLMTYDGYDWRDNVITTVSGIFGLMIVLFPCDCTLVPDRACVGFFQIPVEISSKVHNTSACIFFILLAINSMFLFTLGESDNPMKRIRNIVYRVCAIGMVTSMVLMVLPVDFPAKTFVVEAVALTFFGISWLVKGQVFGLFTDK